jgi:glucokinase
VILAIDVGGTNTRLALHEAESAGPRAIASAVFASRNHASLQEIIELFLAEPARKAVRSACIGVAGPLKEGRVVLTNLAWAIDAHDLARRFSIPHVELINDVEANAWGIAALRSADVLALNDGAEVPHGTAAVIAAGTGLGQAALVWNGEEHMPIPSEGGHVDFAPRNALEDDLLQYLRAKLGKRVSYERVLSGPGLVNVYDFLRDTGREEEPEWLASRFRAGNAPAEISAAADRCALADSAMQLFVSIFGAATGNVALHLFATAGVYLGGGIAPKISAKLRSKAFIDAYLDKGRLSPLLAAIPVRVIMNDKTALLGAARCAWQRFRAGKV